MIKRTILLIIVVGFVSCGPNLKQHQNRVGEYEFHFEDSVKQAFPALTTGENLMYILPNGDIRLDSSLSPFGVLEGKWSVRTPNESEEFTLDFGKYYGSYLLRATDNFGEYRIWTMYFKPKGYDPVNGDHCPINHILVTKKDTLIDR